MSHRNNWHTCVVAGVFFSLPTVFEMPSSIVFICELSACDQQISHLSYSYKSRIFTQPGILSFSSVFDNFWVLPLTYVCIITYIAI